MSKLSIVIAAAVLWGCTGPILPEGEDSPPEGGGFTQSASSTARLHASRVDQLKADSVELRHAVVTTAPQTTATSKSFKLVASISAQGQP